MKEKQTQYEKTDLIVHTSFDGFVAGPNGELDWFEAGEENLEFVCQITHHADAALFGRISYQLLDSYWPTAANKPNASKGEIEYSKWYNAAEKIVLSETMKGSDLNNTTIISGNILNKINKIKQQPGKDILILGSAVAFQSLLQLDLIDGYWIFINPVIFGRGIPLFADTKDIIKLRLLATKQFSNGEIALNYIVIR